MDQDERATETSAQHDVVVWRIGDVRWLAEIKGEDERHGRAKEKGERCSQEPGNSSQFLSGSGAGTEATCKQIVGSFRIAISSSRW
jgi:hypothetical protein